MVGWVCANSTNPKPTHNCIIKNKTRYNYKFIFIKPKVCANCTMKSTVMISVSGNPLKQKQA